MVALGVLVSAGMKLTRSYHEKQAGQESGEEEFQWSKLDRPLTEEEAPKVYEESPIDEEGAARIDAIEPVNADDTWTICVYMVGSNLEDMDENYLTFSCDNDTEAFRITGVRKIPESGDDANFMYNTKSNEKVEEGSRIVPVYRVTDLMANSDQDVDGEEITFSEKSDITREALEDGYYVMTARISDQRGDTYYSPVVGATVKGGKVVKWKTDPNFYGKSY